MARRVLAFVLAVVLMSWQTRAQNGRSNCCASVRRQISQLTARFDSFVADSESNDGNQSIKRRACKAGSRYRSQGYLTSELPNLTYDRAKYFCESYGGHLPYVNMKSITDRRRVMQMMGIQRKLFWIGLTDRIEHDVWRWDDETFADKSSVGFSEGEPTHYGESQDVAARKQEDCIVNWIEAWSEPEGSRYALNDLRCNWPLQGLSSRLEEEYFPGSYFPVVLLCEFDC